MACSICPSDVLKSLLVKDCCHDGWERWDQIRLKTEESIDSFRIIKNLKNNEKSEPGYRLRTE